MILSSCEEISPNVGISLHFFLWLCSLVLFPRFACYFEKEISRVMSTRPLSPWWRPSLSLDAVVSGRRFRLNLGRMKFAIVSFCSLLYFYAAVKWIHFG